MTTKEFIDELEEGCSCCGAPPKELLKLREHPHGKYFNAFSELSLASCQRCSFERTVPWPTSDQLSEFYGKAYNDKLKRTFGKERMGDETFPAKRAAQQAAFIQAGLESVLTSEQKEMQWPRVVAEGGAGWGLLLRQFAFSSGAEDRELHMFEYDEEALEYAKNVECKDTKGKMFLHMGACRASDEKGESGLEPGSVDLILSSHTIEHVPRPLQEVKSWVELLKPGGLCFIEGPLENPHPLNCVDGDDPYYGGHISFFKMQHYIALCERAGLVVLRIQTTNEPVNPVLNQPEHRDPNLLKEGSEIFSGQDRLCLLLCRKPNC